jgi:L-rhamnose mutarotase
MQRICQLIHVRPEAIAEYKRIHAEVWPAVQARLEASHVTNYSIYLREPENLLVAYFEYTGDDLAADSAAIAADPETQRWWTVTDPMQRALDSLAAVADTSGGSAGGSWWAPTEEVFHLP